MCESLGLSLSLCWSGSLTSTFLRTRLIEETYQHKRIIHQTRSEVHVWVLRTLGKDSGLQMRSRMSLSRISHAKMEGDCLLYLRTCSTTLAVATRGLEPPMALGRMEPVS